MKELLQDNRKLHSKVAKVKDEQDELSMYIKSAPWTKQTSSVELIPSPYAPNSQIRSQEQDSGSRLVALEKVVSDFTYSVDRVNDKVSALNELHESTSQLFTALENLETKYDARLNDMQTTLAQMEASVSSVAVNTEDLKEQLVIRINYKKFNFTF